MTWTSQQRTNHHMLMMRFVSWLLHAGETQRVCFKQPHLRSSQWRNRPREALLAETCSASGICYAYLVCYRRSQQIGPATISPRDGGCRWSWKYCMDKKVSDAVATSYTDQSLLFFLTGLNTSRPGFKWLISVRESTVTMNTKYKKTMTTKVAKAASAANVMRKKEETFSMMLVLLSTQLWVSREVQKWKKDRGNGFL